MPPHKHLCRKCKKAWACEQKEPDGFVPFYGSVCRPDRNDVCWNCIEKMLVDETIKEALNGERKIGPFKRGIIPKRKWTTVWKVDRRR